VVGSLVAVCWIVEQHASSTSLDSVDHVDCEIGIVLEAVSVTLSILLAVRVHDLSCGDLSHELSEGRTHWGATVYLVDLFGIGYELGFEQALSVSVD